MTLRGNFSTPINQQVIDSIRPFIVYCDDTLQAVEEEVKRRSSEYVAYRYQFHKALKQNRFHSGLYPRFRTYPYQPTGQLFGRITWVVGKHSVNSKDGKAIRNTTKTMVEQLRPSGKDGAYTRTDFRHALRGYPQWEVELAVATEQKLHNLRKILLQLREAIFKLIRIHKIDRSDLDLRKLNEKVEKAARAK